MTHSITNFLTYCEYRKTFLTFFLATVCFNIFPQSKQSDHFFTKGIEFFETGEYDKAIECFSKADELDLKQLPPESSRGLYSKSWIAHCYYKLGNVSKAKEYYQFNYEKKPINRNLTVKSDIENDLAYEELKKSNLDEALTHALNCLQLEEQILGKESLHYIGSCCFIADIYSYKHDYNNVIKYCDLGLSSLEALDITSDSNTYTLLEMRIYAYLSMNLVAMTYRDLDRLETLCINDEYWMNNSRAKASLNIMKALVELRQNQKDDSKIYDYIKQAFYSYLDIYDPNDEFVFNQLSYCVKLLEVSNGYDLIFNLLKNAIAQLELKNLSNRHKGLILSVMGSYITDIDDGYDILIQASDLLYKCADWDGYFNVRSKIGIFYQEKERYQEALDIYTQICEYYKSSGNNTSVYRRSLMRLGDLYRATASQ